MEGLLKLRAVFRDPNRDAIADEIPMKYSPGQEQQACAALISTLAQMGGVTHFESHRVTFFPLDLFDSITVEAPAIVCTGGGLITT